MITKPTTHVRLPQRADGVEGPERSGSPGAKAPALPDPRIVTQDPTAKPKGMTP
jgi:hypothetical protein